MRDEKRWRQTVKREVQFYAAEGEWETRFLILPTTIGKPGAGLGLFAAKEYKARQNVAVYMGQDVGNATTPLAGQSEHIVAMGGRQIDGLHGASGAQYINAAYHLNTGQIHNAKFTSTGTIVTTTKIKKRQEILLEYEGELWARKARAQKWREAHPVEAEALRRDAEEGDVMMAQKKHDVPTQERQARGAADVSEGEKSREQRTNTGSEGKEEDRGAETIWRHEGKQGAAKGTREAKTEGGAQKYTQESDDPTAREGGAETGMEEEYEEQETEAGGPAGIQGR
jgi:hypothetical protein